MHRAGKGRRTAAALVVFIALVACGGRQVSSVGSGGEGGAANGKAGSGGGDGSVESGGRVGGASGSSGTVSVGGAGATAGKAAAGSGPGGVGGAIGAMAGGGGEGGSKPRPDLRSGSFKMLVFSRTAGYRHDGAINACLALLKQIASEQGFEVVATEASELFTATGLAPFEIVFFNNTSGDVLSDAQQQAYEAWMTDAGAFAGVHSATDTEDGWPFYAEVTGQFQDGRGAANLMGEILLEASAVNHPAIAGLPNPWKRAEEWFKFKQHFVWTSKPGFRVLGRKAADSEPITWVREWGNFRSFYTGLGHEAAAFEGPDIKQHLTGGIMWAVRREHLIK